MHLPKGSQPRKMLCKGSYTCSVTDTMLSALSSSQNSHCLLDRLPQEARSARALFTGAAPARETSGACLGVLKAGCIPVQGQADPAERRDLMRCPEVTPVF